MLYVIDVESEANTVLGPYVKTEEDVVFYECVAGDRFVKTAPVDCVKIVEVPRGFFLREVERWKALLDRDISWVGGDTTVAMNSLVALGQEIVEFAQSFGAAFSGASAYVDLVRKAEAGYRLAGFNRLEEIEGAPRVSAADAERLRADLL
jgi:hypothetical protein